MTFTECCTTVLRECPNEYAKAYAHAGMFDTRASADGGKVQSLYILSNISSWRGETAKAVRTELKRIAGLR